MISLPRSPTERVVRPYAACQLPSTTPHSYSRADGTFPQRHTTERKNGFQTKYTTYHEGERTIWQDHGFQTAVVDGHQAQVICVQG